MKDKTAVAAKSIPYGHQWIDETDMDAALSALKSDWLSQGPRVKGFEEALSRYTGARYAVAVSSGTAALHCACLAAGIHGGDEVITTPITFLASANCILYCGARPVFADVRQGTGDIDPVMVRACATKKTRAIVPVHYAGRPCDLSAISGIARDLGSVVIEDAAHALGARYGSSRVGSCEYSDMTIFSFHPLKSITTGEGGAVTTNDPSLYRKLLLFRNHGMAKDALERESDGEWYYEMQCLGYNYRMTDIQAAVGSSQLKRLDAFIERRRALATAYSERFAGNPYFSFPAAEESALSACHLYPLLLADALVHKKRAIFSLLRGEGIGLQTHYIPVYRQPYYEKLGYQKGLCPAAEDFYAREISIPLFPSMTDEDLAYVSDRILRVCGEVTGKGE